MFNCIFKQELYVLMQMFCINVDLSSPSSKNNYLSQILLFFFGIPTILLSFITIQ